MAVTDLAAAPTTLRGVGPTRAHLLARLGIITVGDLLYLLPARYEDRSQIVPLAIAAAHGEGLVRATVLRHDYFPHGGRRVLKIVIADDSGTAALVCFGRNVLARTFPPGNELLIFGSFSHRYGEIQSSAFEAEPVKGVPKPPGLLPVYPLTDGLTQRILRDLVGTVVRSPAARLEDPLPPAVLAAEELSSLSEAVRTIHRPPSLDAVDQALHRLRFGELFFFQLNLARTAMFRRHRARRARPGRIRHLTERIRNALPFTLTEDQEKVFKEIVTDLGQPWPMNRLLHGDVGSGKTLVALLSAVRAIERGEQTALMVPTELLARQHARTAANLLSKEGVNVALVIGATASPAKRALRDAVAAGEVDLVVGTHALFTADLVYANLGLIIIDEQHRFGVSQRRAIMDRGTTPDLLLMSATPIPRSLALTAFGDSDVSAITQLPPGRKPIRTRLARMGNEERAYRFVHRELEAGRQAYFVYPAIEEGGARGLRSAAEMAEILAGRFAPYAVGVVHSRMDQEERATTMERFGSGAIHVLVATSVVEVGVDVPNATCIVIEHAELFGLAALHQLRGRVGRGNFQSHCILVYQEPLTDDAKERLRVLFQSNDGFHIAEEDLRIRGPGDLLGTRQSGFLRFRFADIRRDMELMLNARHHIATILREDPALNRPEHRAAAAQLDRYAQPEDTA